MRMKRIGGSGALPVLLALATAGCSSSSQRAAERQSIEKSIRRTSDASVIRDCNRVIRLNPNGHETPEAQAASVVVPRRGTTWVVYEDTSQYTLYSCRDTAPTAEPQAPEPREPPPSLPPATALAPSPPAAGRAESDEKIAHGASKTRVTSNPEAVKGCRYLESFLQYRTVAAFQEDVVRSGGNVGYVVATNRDGEVVGESYSCPGGP